MRTDPMFLGILAYFAIGSTIGCDPDAQEGYGEPDGMIVWTDSIAVEETDSAVNVFPMVRPDVDGGFLVADKSENQFRKYSASGRLIAAFGRQGAGPGEFRRPTAVIRLPDGDILGFDTTGRVSIFQGATYSHLRSFDLPLTDITDAALLPDGSLLVAGSRRGEGRSGARLHAVDLGTNDIRRSFFHPMAAAQARIAASTGGWVRFTQRGDTIAAIFSVLDTLYLFSNPGVELEKIPLRTSAFRVAADPPAEARRDAAKQTEWAASFDALSDLHWLTDGSFVIPFQSFENNLPVWRLMVAERDGVVRGSLQESNRLLAVTRDGRLLFQGPTTDSGSVWLTGRLSDVSRRPSGDLTAQSVFCSDRSSGLSVDERAATVRRFAVKAARRLDRTDRKSDVAEMAPPYEGSDINELAARLAEHVCTDSLDLDSPAVFPDSASPAPQFEAAVLVPDVSTGALVRLERLRGAPVLVYFPSSGCEACIRQVTRLPELARTYAASRLQVVAVVRPIDSATVRSLDRSPRGTRFAVLLDSDAHISSAYPPTRTPRAYLVDREGLVIDYCTSCPPGSARLERLVDRIR